MKSRKIFKDDIRGEEVELGSGIVLKEKQHDNSKFDVVTNEEGKADHSRTTTAFHNNGLGSIAANVDFSKRGLSNSQKAFAKTINKWQDMTRQNTAEETRLVDYFQAVEAIGIKIGLPLNIRDDARVMIRKLEKRRALKSRHLNTAILAIIRLSCKTMNYPLDINKIRKEFGVRKALLFRYTGTFQTELQITYGENTPADVLQFNKFSSIMNLKPKAITLGLSILEYNRKRFLTGALTPKAVAAAVVYISAQNTGTYIPKEVLSEKLEVNHASVVTAQKRLADVCHLLKLKKVLLNTIENYREDSN